MAGWKYCFAKGVGYVTWDQKVIGNVTIINGLPYFSPKGPATDDSPQGATSERACAQKEREAPQPAPRLSKICKAEATTQKGPQPTPRPLKGSNAKAVVPKPPQPAPRPPKANPATDKSEDQDEEVSLPGPEGEDEPSSPKREDTPSSHDSSTPTTPQRPVMPSTWDRGPHILAVNGQLMRNPWKKRAVSGRRSGDQRGPTRGSHQGESILGT
ncbi:hypothetical protein E2320_014421, partial [Naja naja]